MGVRDAYKAAFMNRVFPGFDGSLAVELKTPLRVSRNFELHKFSSTCVYASLLSSSSSVSTMISFERG